MIIYPLKQYNPITGSESWLNPAPFILEERDLGIVHDIKAELFGEEISGMEIYDFMRRSAVIGKRIDRGQLNNCQEIQHLPVTWTVRGEDGQIRHDIHTENVIRACNHFIDLINSMVNRFRGEAFATIRGKEGWALECDICQGTSTAYIYDHELARSTENEIEKRAIKLAMEMVKNGEVR